MDMLRGRSQAEFQPISKITTTPVRTAQAPTLSRQDPATAENTLTRHIVAKGAAFPVHQFKLSMQNLEQDLDQATSPLVLQGRLKTQATQLGSDANAVSILGDRFATVWKSAHENIALLNSRAMPGGEKETDMFSNLLTQQVEKLEVAMANNRPQEAQAIAQDIIQCNLAIQTKLSPDDRSSRYAPMLSHHLDLQTRTRLSDGDMDSLARDATRLSEHFFQLSSDHPNESIRLQAAQAFEDLVRGTERLGTARLQAGNENLSEEIRLQGGKDAQCLGKELDFLASSLSSQFHAEDFVTALDELKQGKVSGPVMGIYASYGSYHGVDSQAIRQNLDQVLKKVTLKTEVEGHVHEKDVTDLKLGFNLYMSALHTKFPPHSVTFVGIGASAEPVTEYIRQSGSGLVGNIPLSAVTDDHLTLVQAKPRSQEQKQQVERLKNYIARSFPNLLDPTDKSDIVLMDAVDKGNTLKVLHQLIGEMRTDRQVRMFSLSDNNKGDERIETLRPELIAVHEACKNIFKGQPQTLLPERVAQGYQAQVLELRKDDEDLSFYDTASPHSIPGLISSQDLKKILEGNGVRVFEKASIDKVFSGELVNPTNIPHSDRAAYSLGTMVNLILH